MSVVEETYQQLLDAGRLEAAFRRWKAQDKRLAHLGEFSDLVRLCTNRDPDCYQATNHALAALSHFARSGDSDAGTTLLWLFLGVFRSTAGKIGPSALSEEDLEAEMLQAFWEEVAENQSDDKVAGRLFYAVVHRAWKAVRNAHRDRVRQSTQISEVADEEISASGPNLMMLLENACQKGVICESDSKLILATRLEGHLVAEVAKKAGLRRESLAMRRRRAEAKLADWLAGDLS